MPFFGAAQTPYEIIIITILYQQPEVTSIIPIVPNEILIIMLTGKDSYDVITVQGRTAFDVQSEIMFCSKIHHKIEITVINIVIVHRIFISV